MRLFIAIQSLVPLWSESAQVHHLLPDIWNVHHSALNPIRHPNAQSSCLRRFLRSFTASVHLYHPNSCHQQIQDYSSSRAVYEYAELCSPQDTSHGYVTADLLPLHKTNHLYLDVVPIFYNPISAHAILSHPTAA